MENPQVESKIACLVQFLETGKLLTTLAPCRIHKIYRYVNDFLGALAGLGLPPAAAVISKALSGAQINAPSTTPNQVQSSGTELWKSLQELPPMLGWISLVLILIFVGIKIYVAQANAEKKLALAEISRNQFNNFSTVLEEVLDQEEPMDGLNQLLARMRELKQLCTTSDIWIWQPFPESEEFKTRCEQRSESLKKQFQHRWQAPPSAPSVRAVAPQAPAVAQPPVPTPTN